MKNLLLSFVVLGFATTSIFAQEASAVKKATPVVNIESASANNDKDAKAACCKGKSAKECAKGKSGKSCAGKETSAAAANGSASKPACCASKAAGKPGCSGSAGVEKKEENTK